MNELQLEVRREDLPAWAIGSLAEDAEGVFVLDAGLVIIDQERASAIPWPKALGVAEHHGAVYVMLESGNRRAPWFAIDADQFEGRASSLARRIEGCIGAQVAGYRSTVSRHQAGLSPQALQERVMAREEIRGHLEVPSTIRFHATYPGLTLVRVASFVLVTTAILLAAFVVGFMTDAYDNHLYPTIEFFFVQMAVPLAPMVGLMGVAVGGWIWKYLLNVRRPRERMMVLAPDGCVVAGYGEVHSLDWREVEAFRMKLDGDLEVVLQDGESVSLDSGWLDADPALVCKVAMTYRRQALA